MTIDDKIDWRVGRASISILKNFVEEYIKAYTIKGRYEGKPEALIQYSALTDYLKNKEVPPQKHNRVLFLMHRDE